VEGRRLGQDLSVRESQVQVLSPARTFLERGCGAGVEPGHGLPSSAQEQFSSATGGKLATGIMSQSTGKSKANDLAWNDSERRYGATHQRLCWRWLDPSTGASSEETQPLVSHNAVSSPALSDDR
jgi:hypothetical protein